MTIRRRTRQIKVGGVKIGGTAPVSIQSMTKVETSDIRAVVGQIKELERCGCEIIRVAVKNIKDANAVKIIKKQIGIPLVCDIHFDHRLALLSIKNGADKIRLNPGNIRKREDIGEVIRAAKRARIPIRVGVNSGSIGGRGPVSGGRGPGASKSFTGAAVDYIKMFEALDFHDIIISLKASGVEDTVEAYRKMAAICDYPLHLGVTASGPYESGVIKSSIGIGSLLLDGIGDTIRVSLTADPVEEVIAAKRILSAVGYRNFGPDIVSCPTCGRCQVDLGGIVKELERRLTTYNLQLTTKSPLKIAVMGCEVNGPGEAKEADVGIAFGKGSGILFKKGKILKKVTVKEAVSELLKLLTKN
jgi:(E)-4-hydroxy-3-methylbut-2-enyl-diphosphate synthase